MADSSDHFARAHDDEWVRAVIARALLADSEANGEEGAPSPTSPPLGATSPSPATVGARTATQPTVTQPISAPTPSALDDDDWPSATRLDTATIRDQVAENGERARRIAEANRPPDAAARIPRVDVQRLHTALPVQPVSPDPVPLVPTQPAATQPQPQPVTPAPTAVVTEAPSTAPPLTPVEPVLPAEPVAPVQQTVVDDTPLTPVEPVLPAEPVAPVQQTVVDDTPLTPVQPVLPAEPVARATEPATSPSFDAPAGAAGAGTATATTTATDTTEAFVRRQDQVIEPGRVEHGFAINGNDGPLPDSQLVDDVMVESDVSTDGFRSSDLRTILEWLAVIGSALAVALLIKAFVLQAFWIPSESMETTVNRGDRILVNKVSYRLHEVRRGDLVVFNKIEGTAGTDDLIKRAIALPGETIEVRDDGRIWIWGPGEGPEDALLLDEPYLDPQNSLLSAPSASDPVGQDIWHEGCTNNRTPGRCTLDDSSFFMLGDNRMRSADSRFFGPVPEENVVGRAFVRIWPLGDLSTL